MEELQFESKGSLLGTSVVIRRGQPVLLRPSVHWIRPTLLWRRVGWALSQYDLLILSWATVGAIASALSRTTGRCIFSGGMC